MVNSTVVKKRKDFGWFVRWLKSGSLRLVLKVVKNSQFRVVITVVKKGQFRVVYGA